MNNSENYLMLTAYRTTYITANREYKLIFTT